jgi:hypothetical protein
MRSLPYRYRGWRLYSREVTTPEGVSVTVYFFDKGIPKGSTPVDRLPSRATVIWDEQAGLPVLERGYRGYAFTQQEYFEMLERQGGRCAICRKISKGTGLVIDHEHRSGKVRGLLCTKCNSGLGMFQDDPKRLTEAARYLKGGSI